MSTIPSTSVSLLRLDSLHHISAGTRYSLTSNAKRRNLARSARRSPTTRNPVWESRYKSIGLTTEFFVDREKRLERLNKALNTFDQYKYDLWSHHIRNSINLSYERFSRLGVRIINDVFEFPPSGTLVTTILSDVDTTYELGRVLSKIDPVIEAWTTEATAQAGAVRPNLGLVARLIKTVDRTPKLFQAVKILAERDEYPSAMALYAKILWKQGKDDQAMCLLDKLIHRLYPTMVPPLGQDDLTIGGALEPPWELYAAIIEQNGQHEKTNTILKTAALTFEDPGSLLNYAHIERVKGNMDVYERCMVKAAASGHQEAFRKLANFYLLVSLGRQATHEQKRIGSILLRLIGQGRSLQTYRKMAIDWYELGFARECGRSTIILAALLREDGDLERANLCLTKAEEDEKFPKVVQKMRQKWDSDNFKFPFPDPWMDID